MDAVILAGGLGKRLRPITDYVPKPLIPISNTPILEWQARYLKKHGVQNVTICTGYLTGQIESFLEAKRCFGIKIQVSAEDSPLGTGGAIKNASGNIRSDPFLVMNGDIITDIDLDMMTGGKNQIAGIHMRTQFGRLDVSGDVIESFEEKKPLDNVWMNAGIYSLSRDILADLPDMGDIEKTTFPEMAKKGQLHMARFPDAAWFSIDSHKDIDECSAAIGAMTCFS